MGLKLSACKQKDEESLDIVAPGNFFSMPSNSDKEKRIQILTKKKTTDPSGMELGVELITLILLIMETENLQGHQLEAIVGVRQCPNGLLSQPCHISLK